MAESKDYGSASTPPPGDDDSARMLAEMKGLRQDVQKVELGLSAVLGLDGLRNVLEHGFNQNAEVLSGFRDAFTPRPIDLSTDDTELLKRIALANVEMDHRGLQLPLPSAVGMPPVKKATTTAQFPDSFAAPTQKKDES